MSSCDQRQLKTLSQSDHGINEHAIDAKAVDIVKHLAHAGYEAYLVGGCIRDLLLGKQPKDYDIATSATPEQVHALFKRSRIVGRRFRIVHVRAGRDIIEVTTFRGQHSNKNKPGDANSNAQGMLLRDNVFGSLIDDALRRDFTVNALYYKVSNASILDYTCGLDDIRQQTLRIIGEATQRYEEDPVRLLRAIRFCSKLGFQLEKATAAPIKTCAHLLTQVSNARLFDEALKLFMHGHALATYQKLKEYGLLHPLFPQAAPLVEQHPTQYDSFIQHALSNTDNRIREKKPVTPAFLFAALLWPVVDSHSKQQAKHKIKRGEALLEAGFGALDQQQPAIAIPRRFSIAMREIWSLQNQLENAKGRRAVRLLTHPRFRAAYDFLLLREQAGEKVNRRGQWWTELQQEHNLPPEGPKRYRRQR